MTGMLVFTVTVPAGQNGPATATSPTDIPVSMYYQKFIWVRALLRAISTPVTTLFVAQKTV